MNYRMAKVIHDLAEHYRLEARVMTIGPTSGLTYGVFFPNGVKVIETVEDGIQYVMTHTSVQRKERRKNEPDRRKVQTASGYKFRRKRDSHRRATDVYYTKLPVVS